jgi:hypothetical protein
MRRPEVDGQGTAGSASAVPIASIVTYIQGIRTLTLGELRALGACRPRSLNTLLRASNTVPTDVKSALELSVYPLTRLAATGLTCLSLTHRAIASGIDNRHFSARKQ